MESRIVSSLCVGSCGYSTDSLDTFPLGEVWADAELVWANCRQYNGEGSPLDELGQQARASLTRRWTKARLPRPGVGAPSLLFYGCLPIKPTWVHLAQPAR